MNKKPIFKVIHTNGKRQAPHNDDIIDGAPLKKLQKTESGDKVGLSNLRTKESNQPVIIEKKDQIEMKLKPLTRKSSHKICLTGTGPQNLI